MPRNTILDRAVSARRSAGCRAMLALVLATRTLGAQNQPAPVRDSSAAHGVVGAGPSAVPVGARVRVTVRDRSVHSNPDAGPVGGLGRVEGTFVGIDTAAVELRLDDSTRMVFPFSSLRALELRTGPGTCARSAGRSATCTVTMAVAGAALGFVVGEAVGRVVGGRTFGSDDKAAVKRRWRAYGIGGGAVLGLALRPLVGRDRWEVVRSWIDPREP